MHIDSRMCITEILFGARMAPLQEEGALRRPFLIMRPKCHVSQSSSTRVISGFIASARAINNAAHPYSKPLFRSAQESFVHGWQQAMWAGVIMMTIVLVYVLVRGPERACLDIPE